MLVVLRLEDAISMIIRGGGGGWIEGWMEGRWQSKTAKEERWDVVEERRRRVKNRRGQCEMLRCSSTQAERSVDVISREG